MFVRFIPKPPIKREKWLLDNNYVLDSDCIRVWLNPIQNLASKENEISEGRCMSFYSATFLKMEK